MRISTFCFALVRAAHAAAARETSEKQKRLILNLKRNPSVPPFWSWLSGLVSKESHHALQAHAEALLPS